MIVINKELITKFFKKHASAKKSFEPLLKILETNDFDSFKELTETFKTVDYVYHVFRALGHNNSSFYSVWATSGGGLRERSVTFGAMTRSLAGPGSGSGSGSGFGSGSDSGFEAWHHDCITVLFIFLLRPPTKVAQTITFTMFLEP